MTTAARRIRRFEIRHAIAIEEHVLARAVELLPCGADAACVCFVVDEVLQSEQFGLGGNASLAFAPALQYPFRSQIPRAKWTFSTASTGLRLSRKGQHEPSGSYHHSDRGRRQLPEIQVFVSSNRELASFFES